MNSVLGKLRRPLQNQAGMSLLEAMISVLLMAITAAAIFGGFSTAYKGEITANMQYQAMALARGQIDSIEQETYIDYSIPSHGTYSIIDAPAGYTVQVTVTPINRSTGQALPAGQDNGVQIISVSITFNNRNIKTLADYKVNR